MRIEPRTIGSLLLATFSALVVGLAIGAAWMVLALYARDVSAWMALPMGIVLGWVTRAWITQQRRQAMVLATLGMLLAIIYMRLLFAAAQVGASLGLGFGEALRTAGPGMLVNVARLSLHWRELALYMLGMALAAWTSARQGKRKTT